MNPTGSQCQSPHVCQVPHERQTPHVGQPTGIGARAVSTLRDNRGGGFLRLPRAISRGLGGVFALCLGAMAVLVGSPGCGGGLGNDDDQVPSAADLDDDGYNADVDCDDTDVNSAPSMSEQCDGKDNNCDGTIDEGLDQDNDSDGYSACPSINHLDPDCNDALDTDFPGAEEICDGHDNNCDGQVDEGFDQDADGVSSCATPADCDDMSSTVAPGAEERCDALDNNCNGQVDEGLPGDSYEPNDSREAPSELGTVGAEPLRIVAAVSATSDLDWYRFELSSSSPATRLRVRLENLPSGADYAVSLFAGEAEAAVGVTDTVPGETPEYVLELAQLPTVPDQFHVQVAWRQGTYGCPPYTLVLSLEADSPVRER